MDESKIISCPKCHQKLRVPSNLGALDVKCPACKTNFSWDSYSQSSELKNSNDKQNSLAFVKEVAKYFMEFLETDFHKRRNPKRSIRLRNESNLLVGLNLNKYPAFNNLMWRTITNTFNQSRDIEKGRYKTQIPKNLLDLIRIQTDKISNKQLAQILEQISEELQKVAVLYEKEYDKALTCSLEGAGRIIKSDLALPFISNLEKPLENLNLGDENSIYLMEEELTDILVKLLENKISEMLKLILSKEPPNILRELKLVFDVHEVKNHIVAFFESFQVTDLYAEIYEIDRNRNILDKQEFYLYFCDISFNNAKYPIFYIPFSVEKANEHLRIDFDYQVYVNKKALGYIAQEYNTEKGKRGSLRTITKRIVYLAEHKNDFKELIRGVIDEIVSFFELDYSIDIENAEPQVARSFLVRVSNSCYISLFDNSDEALVNDYEEILQLLSAKDDVLADAFNKLVDDFIRKNPEPFNLAVEDEWDNTGTSDKLVFPSPIPLNSEQRQILSTLSKKGCKYITVEGPPGTGKSHTITAIVFEAILKDHSVLVLSDKKEALDVVEVKITEAMNKVRPDKNFQNPILRLGKTGSTYSQILSKASLENIKNFYRAARKKHQRLEQTIDRSANTLKDDLDAEIWASAEVDKKEIFELLGLEKHYQSHSCQADLDEVLEQTDSATELEEFRNIFLHAEKILDGDSKKDLESLLKLFDMQPDNLTSPADLISLANVLASVLDNIQELNNTFEAKIELLEHFHEISDKDMGNLQGLINEYENLKSSVFGYFLKGKKLEKLNRDFRNAFPYSKIDHPHKDLCQLNDVSEILRFAFEQKSKLPTAFITDFDYLKITHGFLGNKSIVSVSEQVIKLAEDVKYVQANLHKYPNTLKKIGFEASDLKSFNSNGFTRIAQSDFDRLIRFISLHQKVKEEFINIPLVDYTGQNKNIENLSTLKMTHLLDERVVDFYENNRATATTIRNVIRQKRRFDRKDFSLLKEAFPCILAGIRDYAEYIPLEPELFELVIIDEASQVSIAQAFPALLRAKKVVIFGDKRQFSNVKAALARTDTNKECLNNLKNVFRRHVSEEGTKLVRLEKFNIKTSILEFFEFINNYNARLLKHFRDYKELISYSNKYFYINSLHTMKIRGKSIEEVLRFSFVNHDGREELVPNTNTPEIEFICSELEKLKENNSSLTIGIITPHTNQQKMLMETINRLPNRDYFFEKLKLKIMTFDTCQGEERDIIFYSMVASKELDRLWGIFIKNLANVDLEEEGKIKAQRLNVGFSRAKECIHFVLSKPLEEYNGSIGEALRHYRDTMEEAKKEKTAADVDPKSHMEPKVLNWFYQTRFWNENKDKIEFVPQFQIGKYLKQLDRKYTHPKYVVDFLLFYRDDTQGEHKIIIEYDGFLEHFDDVDEVDKFNYQKHYSEEDIFRRKELEGYGYKFLRINKFNIGKDPIATLDERIRQLTKRSLPSNNLLDDTLTTYEGLQDGDMKECPKCKQVRKVDDFRDPSLITGYGRFCRNCKEIKEVRTRKVVTTVKDKGAITCPKCGSDMVPRTGRYGPFWGCPRFPYCKGTRNRS